MKRTSLYLLLGVLPILFLSVYSIALYASENICRIENLHQSTNYLFSNTSYFSAFEQNGTERHPDVSFTNYTENIDLYRFGSDSITLSTPACDLYLLTNKLDFLSLICVETSASKQMVPTYVLRRIQHPKFEVTTMMYFDPLDKMESAGNFFTFHMRDSSIFSFS